MVAQAHGGAVCVGVACIPGHAGCKTGQRPAGCGKTPAISPAQSPIIAASIALLQSLGRWLALGFARYCNPACPPWRQAPVGDPK